MNVVMKKWKCVVCGYIHQGEEAPERCPQCGAHKYQFTPIASRGWNWLAIISLLVILGALCFTFFSCRSSVTVDNTAVAQLNLNRYLGKWYEVARFDHRFERDLTHCTAHYVLQEDGKITVTNSGMKDGKWQTSTGKAKLTEHPGILRVSFFGPFYSDYRVLMVSQDYSYALVGANGDNYLWILSRTPTLTSKQKDRLLLEAKRRGYRTDGLIWVAQNPS